jgi:hypothetical protein
MTGVSPGSVTISAKFPGLEVWSGTLCPPQTQTCPTQVLNASAGETICNFTITPPTVSSTDCTNGTEQKATFNANVAPSLSDCQYNSNKSTGSATSSGNVEIDNNKSSCSFSIAPSCTCILLLRSQAVERDGWRHKHDFFDSAWAKYRQAHTTSRCSMPLNIEVLKRSIYQVASIIVGVGLSTPVAGLRGKPSREFISVPLRLSAQGNLGKYWALEGAELRETPTATWGYLRVRSLSSFTTEGTHFYGEYFDAEGRFCFSLAFSLSSNEEARSSPVQPGEIRTLHSMASFLSPAVAPSRLALYLVQQTILNGGPVETVATPAMRSPPTISGGVGESLSSVALSRRLRRGSGIWSWPGFVSTKADMQRRLRS